jgi:hypothetical protein
MAISSQNMYGPGWNAQNANQAKNTPGAPGGPAMQTDTHDPTAMQLPAGTTDPNTQVYGGSTYEGLLGDRQYRSIYKPNDFRNFMFGRDPNAADVAVQKAYDTGQGAQTTGENLLSLGLTEANLAQDRQAMYGDWTAQNQALGQLRGLEATQGPSGAQAQLMAGNNAAMGQQLALARSGRGFGGGAASAGLAQSNMAGIGAQNANNAAMLSAQENAAWRQRQAGNLGTAAGMYGEQQMRDLNSYYANMGQNDQTALGWAGLGTQAYQGGVNANLAGQQVGNQIRGMELSAGQNLEDQMLRRWAAENGFSMAQAQAQAQQNAALIQGGMTVLGGAIGTFAGGPAGGAVGAAGGNAAGKAVTS